MHVTFQDGTQPKSRGTERQIDVNTASALPTTRPARRSEVCRDEYRAASIITRMTKVDVLHTVVLEH
jgi:hypothetical protein